MKIGIIQQSITPDVEANKAMLRAEIVAVANEGAELVVYTAAVKADNPELVAANEKGIPCIERSVMLGIVTRRYNRSRTNHVELSDNRLL